MRPRQLVSSFVVSCLVATLLVLAVRADGNVVPELDLHDAGIWVVNRSQGAIGRTNMEIETVDTRLDADASDFDVLQSGATVVVHRTDPAELLGLDPALGEFVDGPDLPSRSQVALGGETSALFVPTTGALFIASASSSASAVGLDPAGEGGPVTTIEGDGRLVVGVDGVVHLLDMENAEVTSWSVDGVELDRQVVGIDKMSDDGTMTAVGSMPVVLDDGVLYLPGGEQVDLEDLGDGPVLQQPGPGAPYVLVATDEVLASVPLDGAEPAVLHESSSRIPTAPVLVSGCAYAAWGADNSWAQGCGGDVATGRVAQMDPGGALRFRVNRDRVTLNNLVDGSQLVFIDDETTYLDGEWADAQIDEPDDDEQDDDDEHSSTEAPDCAEDQEAPIAAEDEFGTRPGRPVVVRPLVNDTDANCDLLLIDSIEIEGGSDTRVDVVDESRAVQVRFQSERQVRFRYAVSDGNGGVATATVVVKEIPEGQNEKPVLVREETSVVTNGTVTHNVLGSAYDPDGDVISLRTATAEGAGDPRISSRGEITFTAASVPGPVRVRYVVSDGIDEQAGVLVVNVVDGARNHAPDARNDSASAVVGRTVEVDVLENDSDANGDRLTVVRADSTEDAQVEWDVESAVIRVTSTRPGTVNVSYGVTDGATTSDATLRVEFEEPGAQRPPVAVRDEVRLAGGAPVYVPVLDNDVDPDGEVLVLTGLENLPDPSPISVSVIRRSILKITAAAPLEEPVEFSYRISDGSNVDIGTVLVEPAPVSATNRPPIARPDEHTIRAGGIVVLPVLANDADPEGDPLVIQEPEPAVDPESDGRLFLTAGELRYEAPREPRNTVQLDYEIGDPAGNVSSGRIILHVIAVDGRNRPPSPPDLVGRTLAGQRVVIRVPVTKMDPDGDAVELFPGDEAPTLGSISVGPGKIVYEADEASAGTDEFTYHVRDRFGAEATGRVLVGIARPSTTNNPPIPEDDDAVIRAGDTVEIPVLANDTDPDGDPLIVSDLPDERPVAAVGVAEVTEDGRSIRYAAPLAEELAVTETSFLYEADDGRGGTRAAKVTLYFRDDDTNRPPIAEDDTLEAQNPGTVVRVDVVTDSDEDPDLDPLTVVDTSLPGATVVGTAGHVVQFTMPDTPVQFTYEVTDGERSARAAVFVPVVRDEDLPPVARPDGPVEVEAGASVTIDVLANDSDPEGADLHLLGTSGVRHGRVELSGDDVVFTAEEGYAGDGGLAYTVGDGSDPGTANVSVGAVEIRVVNGTNTNPLFTALPLEVPQDGERTIDLTRGVVDPDDDQTHTFDQLDAGSGLDASLSGSQLRVRVSRSAVAGTVVPIRFRVSDGEADVQGTVSVTIVSSDRPLPTASPDVGRTYQGRSETYDVLANDVNPYPDDPLRIVAVTAPSDGAGTASVAGGAIEFSPSASFFGQTTFAYRIRDVLDDPAREAQATVTVTVIGRPDKPAAPFCIGGESREVRIEWVAPNANGAPIEHYLVRVNEGGSSSTREVSNATIQTIDGLENGRDYTFQVAAVNEAVTDGGGEPEFSEPSPMCRPDEVPGQPDAPVTEFGDRELLVTWTAPENDGSEILEYRLVNTTTGDPKSFGPTTTSATWGGLQNGTSYRFTVAARNELGWGPASELSTGDSIPAGVPETPSAPYVQQTVGARDGFLDVHWDWSTSKDNGDAASAFRITVFRNGSQTAQTTVSNGAARSQTFDTDNGEEYQFTVEAENKAGWSAPSARSAVAVSAAPPDAVSSVSATEGDRQSVLSFSAPADNGAAITGYEYSQNGTGWSALSTSGSSTLTATVGGLTNGTNYTFRVRARNADGVGPDGASSNTVRPYGVPTTPSISASVSGQTITWNWTASDGNGRDIVRYEIRLDSGGWQNNGTSRSYQRTFGYAETHTLRVRAISNGADPARNTSGVGSASGTTVNPPSPSATISKGASASVAGCETSGCRRVHLELRNFSPGTKSASCQSDDDGAGAGGWSTFWTETVSVGSNGSFSGDLQCTYGVPGGRVRVVVDGVVSNTFTW